jgi:esterase/lipase
MEYFYKNFSDKPSKTELEIMSKLDKFQQIINNMNNHVCLIRTKLQCIDSDLKEIKELLSQHKIFPKKIKQNKDYYFFESSQSTDFDEAEV